MKLLILLLLAFAISGCSTRAGRETDRIKAAAAATFDQATQCRTQGQSAEWQQLAPYLPPLDGTEPSMTLRTNNDLPTTAQASLLVKLFNDQFQPCQALVVANLHTVHPSLAAVIAEFNATANHNYARLAGRQISWGAYAGLSASSNAEARANWTKTGQKIEAELAAREDAERERRQAALNNLYNVLATQTMLNQNQQLINAANQPRMTTCTRAAGTVSCMQF